MKHRVILSTVVFLSFLALTQVRAQIQPRQSPNKPFQDIGKDVSQDGWSGWQAPVSTVDPGRMISDGDASNSNAVSPFGSATMATTLDQGKPEQMEKTKAIEVVKTTSVDTVADQPPVLAATVARKGGMNKIVLIGGGCLALLAFRLFRRQGNIPKKPRYL